MTSLEVTDGVAVFTDGSANYKDKSGGWAWIAVDALDGIKKASGHHGDTTVNQMELTAPSEGLEYLHDAYGPLDVIVYSDSEYVVKGATDRQRKRRVNQEFWKRLDAAVDSHKYVEFIHVKGHSDQLFNEMADELAGNARKAGLEARTKESK